MASYEKIHIVLGNESCDLDSTVSSIALAFFLHLKLNANNLDSNTAVLPVMNVNANLFPLRTESCYLLTMNGIDINTLIYRYGPEDLSGSSAFGDAYINRFIKKNN